MENEILKVWPVSFVRSLLGGTGVSVTRYGRHHQRSVISAPSTVVKLSPDGARLKKDTMPGGSDAFATASRGGRHAGFLETYREKTPGELKKGIKSFQEEIDKHAAWIADPTEKVKDFHRLSEQVQKGLINKWQKDIARQREQQEILRRLLEEKTSQ